MEIYTLFKVNCLAFPSANCTKYIIRDIKVVNNLTKKESIVKQIHFVALLDHSVPDIQNGNIFLIFNQMINFADNYRNNNPMLFIVVLE